MDNFMFQPGRLKQRRDGTVETTKEIRKMIKKFFLKNL